MVVVIKFWIVKVSSSYKQAQGYASIGNFRELKHAATLFTHGRKPVVNISHASTVSSTRFVLTSYKGKQLTSGWRLRLKNVSCLSQKGRLNTRIFDTRTVTGRELFSLLTCLHATTFTLRSIVSLLEMIIIIIWGTPLSWHAKCSLPVTVRV